MTAFSADLKAEWEAASRDDEMMRAELLDAIAYMAAFEGGTLPPEFQTLLLPSTLQELIRDTYDRGHEDEDARRRVVAWGAPARSMKMDEATREETHIEGPQVVTRAVLAVVEEIEKRLGTLLIPQSRLSTDDIGTVQDELLRARILEARANSISTPFGDRDALRRQAAELRVRNRMFDEFEVERQRTGAAPVGSKRQSPERHRPGSVMSIAAPAIAVIANTRL